MLFIPWICLLSFIFLEAPCRHNFMNATQTPHAWAFSAVHPSIYRPVPPWFTMTARPPPASPRSLPCSSPLKCLHESEALARNVGKSSLPNPTSNDRISHGFSWGLKSSHFFVALLKTCRIGMCHWRLFFVFGGGPYLSSQNAMWFEPGCWHHLKKNIIFSRSHHVYNDSRLTWLISL